MAISSRRLIGRLVLLAVLLCSWTAGASAQVSVKIQGDEILITNPGFDTQRAVRMAGKSTGSWSVVDNVGNVYRASGAGPDYSYAAANAEPTGRDDPEDDEIIIIGGYQGTNNTGRDDPEDEEIIMIGGYQDVLKILEEQGATIVRDPVLGVDLLSFPDAEDPITTFFTLITTLTYNGRPLIHYLGLVEINNRGVFDTPVEESVTPLIRPLPFPNDPYLSNEWNLIWTRTADAQWHPAGARKKVKIGVIDSGIRIGQRRHNGLDGTEVRYKSVAPEFDLAVPHTLEIVTLLGDRGNDGAGIIGLLGDAWDGSGCNDSELFFSRNKPSINVYNVGDLAPISLYLARAIRKSVQDGVDVINLSLAIGYSPLVERAIKEALEKGVVVVASAGNYPAGVSKKSAKFPANIDGVIAVGSAGMDMSPSSFSANSGVDIYAPGELIVAGGMNDAWIHVAGTSFAAPHVTAAVAMMRAARPDLSLREIEKALTTRAQAKGASRGVGFLNTFSSLNHVLPARERVRETTLPINCVVDALQAGKTGSDLPWNQFVYDSSIDDDLFDPAPAIEPSELPVQTTLEGNYPNPFNPETTIRYTLKERGHVRLAVYNTLGQEIAVLVDGSVEAGTHNVRFEAPNLPSGVYLTRLEAAGTTMTRSIVLIK